MIVALMSDTHDNLSMIKKAVDVAVRERASYVLHAGDLVSPFTIPHLCRGNYEFVCVWGNNEGDRDFITKRLSEHGGRVAGLFAELEVGGVKIALTHGHVEALVNLAIASGRYDYVVYGHTHRAEERRVGKTVVVNPGEVCGYLSGRATMALLDTEARRVTLVDL